MLSVLCLVSVNLCYLYYFWSLYLPHPDKTLDQHSDYLVHQRTQALVLTNQYIYYISWNATIFLLHFIYKQIVSCFYAIISMNELRIFHRCFAGFHVGCPFAKIFAHQFCAKKTTVCAIIRKSHFTQNCPIPLSRNSSFAQFHNFVKIKRLVTICVSYSSILEKSCFGMSSYWSLLHNWPMTIKKSSNLTIFSTILVLDMHIS